MYIKQLFPSKKVIGINETDLPLVSFTLSESATKNIRIHLVNSSTAGTVTVQLQGKAHNGDYFDYASSSSSVVIGDGNNFITMNVEDAVNDLPDMPLTYEARLVVTTDGTGTSSFDSIAIQL